MASIKNPHDRTGNYKTCPLCKKTKPDESFLFHYRVIPCCGICYIKSNYKKIRVTTYRNRADLQRTYEANNIRSRLDKLYKRGNANGI